MVIVSALYHSLALRAGRLTPRDPGAVWPRGRHWRGFREQIRLLQGLPGHLKIRPDDIAWLEAAEPAFEFWNNPEDAIYDQL